jgi:hypothetical protein
LHLIISSAQELVVTLRPMTRAQKVAAAAAGVGLVSGAAPDEEGYEEEYEEEEQAPAAPRVVPRGSAVLTRQALLAAKRATSPVRDLCQGGYWGRAGRTVRKHL